MRESRFKGNGQCVRCKEAIAVDPRPDEIDAEIVKLRGVQVVLYGKLAAVPLRQTNLG